MDDKVREALDYLAGFNHLIQVTATIRAHIEGLEARLADADDALTVAYMVGVGKGRESAEARVRELEIACAQAVEFAEYVEGAAKGGMVERAQHYLSLPYSQKLAARIVPEGEQR